MSRASIDSIIARNLLKPAYTVAMRADSSYIETLHRDSVEYRLSTAYFRLDKTPLAYVDVRLAGRDTSIVDWFYFDGSALIKVTRCYYLHNRPHYSETSYYLGRNKLESFNSDGEKLDRAVLKPRGNFILKRLKKCPPILP